MKTRIITAAVGLGVLAVVLAFFDTFLFDLVLSAVCLFAFTRQQVDDRYLNHRITTWLLLH